MRTTPVEQHYNHHPVDDIEPMPEDTNLTEVAEKFARVLEWASRASSLVGMGQRMYVVLYAMRPALIEGMTLEQMGKLNGSTRQAVDKLICDFRDTFGGIQTRNERSDATRRKCMISDKERNFTRKPIEELTK